MMFSVAWKWHWLVLKHLSLTFLQVFCFWHRLYEGFYLTLARDRSQVHCSRPQGELWHDQSPRLWIPVPQPSHSPSWLWFLYPFTQSLSSVSAACFSGWVSGDVLHEGVNSTVREALQVVCLHQCRRNEKVSLFLFSYVSPCFSTAKPGMCCRESMSGLSHTAVWDLKMRKSLQDSADILWEYQTWVHCGNPQGCILSSKKTKPAFSRLHFYHSIPVPWIGY